jgi:hypothetical protein
MSQSNIKMFNTVGPCVPGEHYTLPVLPRLPEDDINQMINGKFYFVLHAPRQSGKTTYLDLLTKKINSEGHYYAINCSLMTLRNIEDDNEAMTKLIGLLNDALENSQITLLKQQLGQIKIKLELDYPNIKVKIFIKQLCENLDKDLIIFFDEADCLVGQSLLSFLGQIRDGYQVRHNQGNKFPRSMALVGMRDIRDYLNQVRPDLASMGLTSPFNIKKKAFTLANFTRSEIGTLYSQHTLSSGQVFEDSAIDRAWYWSEGQPWLVNALAYEIVVEILQNDYTAIIDCKLMDQAAEVLIKRRDTHIDSLLERLKEPRISRIMEPVITGAKRLPGVVTEDDIKYSLDLGLLKRESGVLKAANPIYQEVILRTLSSKYEIAEFGQLPDLTQTKRWFKGDQLDMESLLKEFQRYWQENSGVIDAIEGYPEALAHLVLGAFLQRILNGGVDFLQREFALGRRRLDLCARFNGLNYPIELKIKSNQTFQESLQQIRDYMDMDICRANEGWLVIFDNDINHKWEDKIYWDTQEFDGKTIHVVGC